MKKIFTILGAISGALFMNAQNLIPNPGFENWTGVLPDGWFTTGSTVAQSTTTIHSGASAIAFTAPTTAAGNKTISPTTDTPIDVTKTYVFSGWYLDNTPAAKFKYWNQFRNTVDTGSNAMQATAFSTDSPSWQFFTAEAMPNANSTVARPGLRLYSENLPYGGVIYFDDILFQNKATMAVVDVKNFDKQVKMNTIVKDQLTLRLPQKATVNITSIDGKLMSSNRVSDGESLNTQSLAKGTYIVTVDIGTAKISRKIIKQ